MATTRETSEAISPTFFASQDDFVAWLEAHHRDASELLVGFHKKHTGRPSLTWPESVDAALCFGWIDGVRKTIDAERYTIRFTPRRKGSVWSAVNVRRFQELRAEGKVRPAGEAAFAARDEARTAIYSHEQREDPQLGAAQEAAFRANANAWAFFQAQPPSYRKAALWWVVSAKREDTREKRLATLIADSAAGRTVAPLSWRKASS